jgi:hypothetical protein
MFLMKSLGACVVPASVTGDLVYFSELSLCTADDDCHHVLIQHLVVAYWVLSKILSSFTHPALLPTTCLTTRRTRQADRASAPYLATAVLEFLAYKPS